MAPITMNNTRLAILLGLTGLVASQNTACNVTFSRLSKGDASSWVASVEHDINMLSFEDGVPGVPRSTSSCWQIVGWGAGCGWGKTETTAVDAGWSVAHEVYDLWGDYSADVTLTGNGCDGTVLSCVGSHSSYTLPSPGEGQPPRTMLLSDTKCSLAGGGDVDGLAGGDLSGQQLEALLNQEGDLYGFDGNLGDITNNGAVPYPTPASCMLFQDPETVCTPFWECVDEAASITAYFPSDANIQSTQSGLPTMAPIESPGAC